MGNILKIKVHAANIHDTKAGAMVVADAVAKYPTIRSIMADAGYRGTAKNSIEANSNLNVQISERIKPGWEIERGRWVVERTFAWFNGYRRLSKDYEILPENQESMVLISQSILLLRRFKQNGWNL